MPYPSNRDPSHEAFVKHPARAGLLAIIGLALLGVHAVAGGQPEGRRYRPTAASFGASSARPA
ncbi:MAG: hypothetical protein R3E48_01235 [Burkholderiaceae bacterium]